MWSPEAVGDARGPEQAIEGEHQGHQSRSPAPFIHPRPHRILGLCLRLMPITADYEVSQNNPDIGTSTEGRSIGHVHDKSAPTGVRMILLMFIIGHPSALTPATITYTLMQGNGCSTTYIPVQSVQPEPP